VENGVEREGVEYESSKPLGTNEARKKEKERGRNTERKEIESSEDEDDKDTINQQPNEGTYTPDLDLL
jgi:hypothetical protein